MKRESKKQKALNAYEKEKLEADFYLRHEIGLGTAQIKKLWQRIDVIFNGVM